MSAKAEQIVAEALSLPRTARAYVAEKLIESLDAASTDGLSPAWVEEVRRRCAEIDQGTAGMRDAETAFTDAFAKLG